MPELRFRGLFCCFATEFLAAVAIYGIFGRGKFQPGGAPPPIVAELR